MELPELNLPKARLRIQHGDDGATRVFDPLRGKFVVLTPEEWVRQNFVSYLTCQLGYPAALMGNEVSLTLNGTARRCDTVLFSREGLRPRMIIEYKAPGISLTQKVFDQIVRYNMVLQAPILIVSNGLSHYCCAIDIKARTYSFLPAIPPYSSLQ